MPEGDPTPEPQETTEPQATEPAPEPQPEPAAEPAPESQGPDLTDGISQMNAVRDLLDERLPKPEQDDPFGRFLGQPEPEPEYGDPDYGDPEQPAAPGQQDPLEEARGLIREEFQSMLGPVLNNLEMDRREEGVLALADKIPQLRQPEVIAAVEAAMRTIDPNYGVEGYVPDPKVLHLAYRAAQAELAEQTSQTPEGGQQAPAEAGGSQGQHLETGAGPGAQPREVDPVEDAYEKALAGGGATDPFGFPAQQP